MTFLEKKNLLTPEGAAWLEVALNPFPDVEVKTCGLPDNDTSRVIIQELSDTLTFSAPSGQTSNFSAHIFNLPFANPENSAYNSRPCFTGISPVQAGIQTYQTGEFSGTDSNSFATVDPTLAYAGVLQNSSPLAMNLDLLNVHVYNADGVPLAPAKDVNWAPPAAIYTLGSNSTIPGRRRLIAAGWEVRNVTPILYVSGTGTSYRIPQAEAREIAACDYGDNNSTGGAGAGKSYYGAPGSTLTSADNCVQGKVPLQPFRVYNMPPPTPGDAMLYPGSRQMEAKEGAYVSMIQDVSRNQLAWTDDSYIAFTDGDYTVPTVGSVGTTSVARSQYPSGWATATWAAISAPKINGSGGTTNTIMATNVPPISYIPVPYHTSGLMLTGLSPQSTFTVTLHTKWEISPVTGDQAGKQLCALTKPACPSDLNALRLYQEAATMIPTSVPVSENASGDFWDLCLNALSIAATPVAAAFGFPAAGVAASAGIQGIRSRRNARDEQSSKAMNNMANLDIANFKPNTSNVPQRGMTAGKGKRKAVVAGAAGELARLKEKAARVGGKNNLKPGQRQELDRLTRASGYL